MKINQFTDYSLRVLLYLGLKSDRATMKEIAKAYGISTHHLVKVIHKLGRAGFITSTKGKGGGIRLAKDPNDIRIGDFTKEFEPMNLIECFDRETNTCPIQGICGLERALYGARKAFIDKLNQVTLATFLLNNREKSERLKTLGLSLKTEKFDSK